uniref:NADH-ubiquinone oxidoreductase chain 3 n=1 Tax=Tettigades auropilosa TaxID=1498843 RepID=A0A3S5GL22_9HEMI|nr:NADH dehydrogenase subunit 3 [Tettigades auropilosa]AWV83828.1 NADH dehydrogenase subunit 3 [Tettigades auropilosa]AWV83841.1 NADH dehydrogenase subunit 3 [Tettigades auropilosa]
MFMVLTLSTMLLLLLGFIWLLLYLLSMKSFIDREKSSPFECGFDPISSPRIPFSSHFFLIAVIFLVFDVELVVIMPLMLCLTTNNLLEMYLIMVFFLFILIIGLFHEWNNKMLDWM